MVYGCFHGAFLDNPKYLFFYANEHYPQYEHIWLSTRRDTVENVRQLGYRAYWTYSLKGFYYSLRAKYWFVNCYTSDIIFYTAGGATVVNLWHGVPMKCIEFSITQGESFRKPDYVASTTPFFDEIFSRSFRVEKAKCLHIGCPRNQQLLQRKELTKEYIHRFEPKAIEQLIETMQKFDKVYVYMPTWRDSQLGIFANGFDLDHFNEVLKSHNYLTLMKPHINTRLNTSKQYSNLIFIDGGVDMYPILPFTDVLITDYSGMVYDYILMNKGVIFFHYDYEEYVKEREFFFPINENIAGKCVYSFDELLTAIEESDDHVDPKKREQIIKKFWGDTMTKDVCANIFKQLNLA